MKSLDKERMKGTKDSSTRKLLQRSTRRAIVLVLLDTMSPFTSENLTMNVQTLAVERVCRQLIFFLLKSYGSDFGSIAHSAQP